MAVERDWLKIEAEPWRPREELEAEVDRLKGKLEAYLIIAQDAYALLIEALGDARGRPREAAVKKRAARYRRARGLPERERLFRHATWAQVMLAKWVRQL
jgi:hypothetical protein